MGIKVMLLDSPSDPLRLAFVHVFQKREGMRNPDGTKGKDKFSLNAIFAPGGANADRVKAATAEACKEAWGDNWEDFYAELGADEKAIRKGNLKLNQSGEIYDGFEGMSYVVANNETRPGLYDRDQSPLVAEDGRPYAGCYANVEVEVWAQKARPGVKRRVNVTLLGVQFVRDGDAFGAGAPPSKASSFANLSTEDEKSATGGGERKSSVFDD